jgi:WD40 repeat protein
VRVLSAHKKPINCVAFSPDGTQLAEAANSGDIRVWDLASGAVKHDHLYAYGEFSSQVRLCFAPDGKSLAVTSGDIAFIGLTVVHGKRINGDGKAFTGVAYFPDGKSVVGVGDRYGRYSPLTGGAFPRMKLPAPRVPYSAWPACAISRDGTRLAVSRRIGEVVGARGEYFDTVFVYDTGADAVVAQFEWTGHPGTRLALSPDSAFVAAACGPVLRVWDISAGALVAEKQVGKAHFLGMAFSTDGRYVATASKDQTTRFWEVGAWDAPKTFEWNVGALLDVAFSPDGATAAVSSDKGQIVLFDVD